MNRNMFEIFVGFVVLAIAGWFLISFVNQAYEVSTLTTGYVVKAQFDSVDGVAPGSAVKIGGIKIGVVKSVELTSQYQANLIMTINKDFKIPADSDAQITSSGLLGDKFVNITPGNDDRILKSGEDIAYTQSSVNLENLIGKMIFSKDTKDPKDTDYKDIHDKKPE